MSFMTRSEGGKEEGAVREARLGRSRPLLLRGDTKVILTKKFHFKGYHLWRRF